MPPKPASSSSSYETSSGEEEEVEDKLVPPTNPKPTAPKPQSSGSDDGDEEESSDEEEEDSPPSLTPPSKSKPAPASAPASAPAASASESGSSDSESGSPAPAPAAAAKPRASKPPPSPTKPSPATPTAATPEKKKRKAPATPAATPAATPSGAAPKKFVRLWTDEDEIAVLQGMLDYNAKTGILPPPKPEMEAFRRFIQKSLSVEVTAYQLFGKLRRMKRNYLKTRAKPPSPLLVHPHDAAVYELSQKVWGSGDGVNGSQKVWGSGDGAKKRRTSMVKVEKSEKAEKDDEEEDNVVEGDNGGEGVRKGRYLYFTDAVLRMEDCIGRGFPVKDAIGMIDEAKAKELDRKYKILKVQQMKSYMREMELNNEGMQMVIEAMDKQA